MIFLGIPKSIILGVVYYTFLYISNYQTFTIRKTKKMGQT